MQFVRSTNMKNPIASLALEEKAALLTGTILHTNGKDYTIEGNSGGTNTYNGKVREKAYGLNSPSIAGYGKIDWIG